MVHRMKFVCGVGPTGWPSLTAHIDGQSLSALAEAYERSRGYTDPAGGYGGFELIHVTIRSDGQHFVGCDHPKESTETERFLALACECGDPGCWPLTVRVRVVGEKVIWDRFAQPHRPGRDYREFGPFAFERAQYCAALEEARAAAQQGLKEFEES